MRAIRKLTASMAVISMLSCVAVSGMATAAGPAVGVSKNAAARAGQQGAGGAGKAAKALHSQGSGSHGRAADGAQGNGSGNDANKRYANQEVSYVKGGSEVAIEELQRNGSTSGAAGKAGAQTQGLLPYMEQSNLLGPGQ